MSAVCEVVGIGEVGSAANIGGSGRVGGVEVIGKLWGIDEPYTQCLSSPRI
jgi:hypothetical protein